jgi:PAS domain S-box-containing protein
LRRRGPISRKPRKARHRKTTKPKRRNVATIAHRDNDSIADLQEQIAALTRELAQARGSQRELQSRSAQFAVLVQSIKDYAIYMVDKQGRVVSWNSGAERIKGYTADEIRGQHFSRFYTESDRKSGLPAQALRQAVAEGKFEEEGWRVRKDGSQFWASIVIDPIRDGNGTLIGFAKVTRDITERRQAQDLLDQARERMVQLQKMEAVGQLTGGVAHDFNNLLMVIIGNLEVAQRNTDAEKGSAARSKRAIDSAMRGAQRAAMLTQRLLAFSRRQPLAPKPIDLNKFVVGEVEFLQRTLGETIQVEAVGGAGLWKVAADVNQLQAALLNLAVNARDAMPQGGKLTIETGNAFLDEDYCRANPEVQRGQYVLIGVTDNGAGMTQEVMNRAFEPFFSTKAVGQGTGLGLSQVYGFIKQSGGHIKIYSEPGEGTTVKIYLPRISGDVSAEPEDSSIERVPGERGETILVVEDDDDVRSYLVETLHDLDYRVLRAHDSVAALEFLQQRDTQIDLLLTDVVLPGMNGRELSRKAQSLRPGLRVLFMTGYSRNAIVHQGRLDADVELIQKPITQDQLSARIRMLLDAKRK